MTLQDAIDLVKRERDLIERQHGKKNRTLEYLEWVALIGKRFGYLVQAAATRQAPWFGEELVKIAATAIAAVEAHSELAGLSLDADGIAEIDGADGSRARIVAKVGEAPPSAILVSTDAKTVWIGGGKVYVEK